MWGSGLSLVGRRCLAVRGHDRRVNIEDDDFTEVGAHSPAGTDTAGQLRPHVTPDPGSRGRDLRQPASSGLIQRATPSAATGPDQDSALVAKHVDIGDGLTPIGEQHRHVDQHPATVVARDEVAANHRLGQLPGQARPVGKQPGSDAARMRHTPTTPSPVTDRPTAHKVRFTYEVPSTWRPGTIKKSKNPKQERFRASTRRSRRGDVNDPGKGLETNAAGQCAFCRARVVDSTTGVGRVFM